ncbi:MAG TPA: hypothetical protein ENK23_06540, partial [Sorangium sp.]|nr:hypothetical protein [Sorangium sp.]
VHPGDTFDVTVMLAAKRAIDVDAVSLELSGREWSAPSVVGAGAISSLTPIQLRAMLHDKGQLPAGRTRLRARFQLPPSLAPSFESELAGTRYELKLHVAIPWWPDATRRYVLPITARPRTTTLAPARVHTSHVGGPVSHEAHVEFSLQRSQLTPGETLTGELALYNVAHNRYRQARLSLVGMVELRSPQGAHRGVSPAFRYSIDIAINDVPDGAAIPFAMRLPKTLPASHTAQLWSLAWRFEVNLTVAWGNALSATAPVVVLPVASQVQGAAKAAAPVGGSRVRKLWLRVAGEFGFEYRDGTLVRAGGDGRQIRIAPDYGGEYTTLQAVLRFPSLGLGLDGGPRTGLRRVLQSGPCIDGGSWDKRHYITGRDPVQLRAFVEPLRSLLIHAQLEEASDEQLIVSRRGGGQSRQHLHQFVGFAVALYDALGPAQQLVPPPQLMRPALTSWRALARTLAGKLRHSDMTINGMLDGQPVIIRTVWSSANRPLHTELSLGGTTRISERYQLSIAAERQTGSLAELPKPARAMATRLGEQCLSLTIASDRLVVWETAPAMSTEALLQRLGDMVALARALTGQHGPYR